MKFFQSGNEVVDKIGEMNLTGDVIPKIWYKSIKTEKGKPYYLAMAILADIIYWYRPVEVRDEYTGHVIGWRKKFRADMLQRNYKQMEELFGENQKTIQRALQALEEMGLIKRRWRKISLKNGTVLHNVLFIELFPEAVYEVTYPQSRMVSSRDQAEPITLSENEIISIEDEVYDKEKEPKNNGNPQAKEQIPAAEATDNRENTCPTGWTNLTTPLDKTDHPGGQICPPLRTNLTTPVDKSDHPSGQICPQVRTNLSTGLDKSVHTNTENTRENTKEITEENTKENTMENTQERIRSNHIYPIYPDNQAHAARNTNSCIESASKNDGYDGWSQQRQSESKEKTGTADPTVEEYLTLIQRNISYDKLTQSTVPGFRQTVEELYGVICDVVCIPRKKIRVGGQDYPYQLVKSRFLKLNADHICYVIECMNKNCSRIQNIRAYLITALYNAPTTMENYYGAEVRADQHLEYLIAAHNFEEGAENGETR